MAMIPDAPVAIYTRDDGRESEARETWRVDRPGRRVRIPRSPRHGAARGYKQVTWSEVILLHRSYYRIESGEIQRSGPEGRVACLSQGVHRWCDASETDLPVKSIPLTIVR